MQWMMAMSGVMNDWWAAVETVEGKMDDDEMWVLTDVDGGVAVSLNGNDDEVLVTAMLAGGDADGVLDEMSGRCSHRVLVDNSFDTLEMVKRAMATAGGVRTYKVLG
jgi:hypothetical protein